jgi:hypothetical protein
LMTICRLSILERGHPVQTGGSVAEGMDGIGRSEVQLLSVS